MMLKKPKQQVLDEIYNAAESKIRYNLQNNLGAGLQMNVGSVTYAIQQAIADAVREGFSVMIDNIYTDAEFEEDIGLREKNETQR